MAPISRLSLTRFLARRVKHSCSELLTGEDIDDAWLAGGVWLLNGDEENLCRRSGEKW